MGIPLRSLKLEMDFLARVTAGFCPVMRASSWAAFSRMRASSLASPNPWLMTTFSSLGTSQTFW